MASFRESFKELLKAAGRVKGSLTLFALIAVFYLVFSKGSYFIEYWDLYGLGFSLSRPWSLFSYWFAHTGVFHLVINLCSLLFFALVVELALASVDVVLIFFSSAILSALVYGLFNPGVMLLGASAGIGGLISSALALRLKKSLYALVALFLVLEIVLLPLASSLVYGLEEKLEQETARLEIELDEAVSKGEDAKAGRISSELKEKKEKAEVIETGKKVEKETPVGVYVHSLGAFFGLLYLAVFRRKELRKGLSWVNVLKRELKKGKDARKGERKAKARPAKKRKARKK